MNKNARRIASIEARPGYRLAVVWQDGEHGIINMSGVVQTLDYFESLKDEVAFQDISVVDYGTGIAWANGIDYSADSLDAIVHEQSCVSSEEISA